MNGLPLQTWLQQQVEALVQSAWSKKTRTARTRVAKVRRRSEQSPSDAQLEKLFADKPMPAMPEDVSWRTIIDAKKGKTIKPVEKWL